MAGKEKISSWKIVALMVLLLANFLAIYIFWILPSLTANVISQEEGVLNSIREIYSAQKQYRAKHGIFGSLKQLSDKGFIVPSLGKGQRYGYTFEVTVKNSKWHCTAVPTILESRGYRSWFIDQSGVIRYSAPGNNPTTASPSYSLPLD